MVTLTLLIMVMMQMVSFLGLFVADFDLRVGQIRLLFRGKG